MAGIIDEAYFCCTWNCSGQRRNEEGCKYRNQGAGTPVLSHAEEAMETRAEKLRAPQPAEFRDHILSVSLSWVRSFPLTAKLVLREPRWGSTPERKGAGGKDTGPQESKHLCSRLLADGRLSFHSTLERYLAAFFEILSQVHIQDFWFAMDHLPGLSVSHALTDESHDFFLPAWGRKCICQQEECLE